MGWTRTFWGERRERVERSIVMGGVDGVEWSGR